MASRTIFSIREGSVVFLVFDYTKLIDPYPEYMGIGAMVFKQFFLEFK
jgi:hypothetical protein